MNRRRAFTFVELLIVIAIIGILAGLAVPRLRHAFDIYILDNTAKEIYYLSRYLQDSAISSAKIHYLGFDQSKRQFQALLKGVDALEAIDGRYGKPYGLPEELSVRFLPPEKSAIFFYPDGSIDKITMIFSNRQNKETSLIIKGSSGEIKIQ